MNCAKNAPPPPNLTLNLGLKSRNTFGLAASAQRAFEITDPEQLPALMDEISEKAWPWRVLGGGSNVILPPTLSGATLLMNIVGQEVTHQDEHNTYLAVGAGVNWHELVAWTLEHELPGLENLALIPGTVGAAPIQNIGAYGVEIAQYIDSVQAFDTQTNGPLSLSLMLIVSLLIAIVTSSAIRSATLLLSSFSSFPKHGKRECNMPT
jgi:UDP-N-acetylmuramate dehydrogenase